MTFPVFFLKLLADLCWYFTLTWPVFPLAPLPVVCVLWALPALYTAALVWQRLRLRGREETAGRSRVVSIDSFSWQCKVLLAAAPLECLMFGLARWEGSALWCSLFLCLGVLLRRVCRLGEAGQKDARFWAWNLFTLGIAAVVGTLLASKGARQLLRTALSLFYEWVIVPVVAAVGMAIAFVVNLIIELIVWLFSGVELQRLPEDLFQLRGPAEEITEEVDTASLSLPGWLAPLGWALLFLLLAGAAWLVYKKLTDRAGQQEEDGTLVSRTSLAEGGGKKARRQEGKRNSVRGYYRRFLKLCRKAGISREPQDSSAEIQQKAELRWTERELSPLRELYLEARYSGRASSAQAVAEARAEYQKLKRRKE